MLSGVVFDLDGVIVDSHPVHKQAWRMFLASLGQSVSESDLEFIFEGRRRREILVHFLGELSGSEIEEYGSKKDEFFRKACSLPEPVAGTIEFIKRLEKAGLCVAVATSASQQRAQWTLEQLKIADCFEVVVTGDDVVQSKPDPAIYRLAAHRLSIPPDCLFAVEDSVSGVRSAKSAGLRCLGIGFEKNAHPLLQAGADCVLPNLVHLSVKDLEEAFARPRAGLSAHNESARANSVSA
ncbi:MAG: HAD family phosphatase [Candidatus Sulfotelmatobacter sp.]